jgi:urease accessory protein
LTTTGAGLRLLRLLHLASPALPVGAFAYSQGLEWAAAHGLTAEDQALDWIAGILEASLARVDVPLLARLRAAWERGDREALLHWSGVLRASRETAELRAEEANTAGALARLLRDLGIPEAGEWTAHPQRTYCLLLALAGARWDLPAPDLCRAYLWAWAENQVLAAIKTVPLGQTAGQRLLLALAERIEAAVDTGLSLGDADIGGAAPGQILASMHHETQGTRLFRS